MKMKTGKLARRPVPMDDTERHTVVRFGLKSALVANTLIQCVGQNLQSEVLWIYSYIATCMYLENAMDFLLYPLAK